jgi:hypothetical protein
VHLRAGRHSKAEPLLARALTIIENAHDPQHRDVAVARENYAAVLRKMKSDPDADRFDKSGGTAFQP